MSAQDYADELDLLEKFRLAAWGKNPFIKSIHPPGLNTRTIKYLDFGEHLFAVRSFCHAVDNRLVVFREYDTAMDRFEGGDTDYSTGASIIGQPGIGKTCFISYAVVVRLRNKKPVAVQVSWEEDQEEYLLFTSNAVTIHRSGDRSPLEENGPIWVFSDSNNAVLEPCLAFLNFLSANVRVFQTTSPAEHHWKDWTKKLDVNLYIMDVPSCEEIEDLAVILGEDAQGMKTLAEKWGPVPRTLLECLAPTLESNLAQMVTDAVYMAIGNPEMVFQAIAKHNSSEVRGSSTVFFIKPKSETHRTHPSIYIPTRWLTHQLVDALFHYREYERASFFDMMSVHLQARAAFGWMFEAVAHHFLANERNLIFHWCDRDAETLSLGPLQTHSGDFKAKQNSVLPYYWRPPSTDGIPGIDGVIITNSRVFVIQPTIQFQHRAPTDDIVELRSMFHSNKQRWSRFKVLFVGFCDEQAKSVANSYRDGLEVTARTHLDVGWLAVPLDKGFEFLRLALENDGDQEGTTDEEAMEEGEAMETSEE